MMFKVQHIPNSPPFSSLISKLSTAQGNEATDLRAIAKCLLFGQAGPNPSYAEEADS